MLDVLVGLTSFACRRRIEDTSRYHSPHVLITVSFVMAPRKEYRFLACPRGSIGPHTSSHGVSVPCTSSQGCTYLALCASGIVRWITSQGLRPLHDYSRARVWCGCGFDLRVAGCYPAPPDYIVCTSTVGVDIVCTSLGYIVCVGCVSLSRCGWCVVWGCDLRAPPGVSAGAGVFLVTV